MQPSTPESLYTTDEIMRHASKHLSGISVLSPGGNQSYPAVWASLLVIAVDTAANMEALLALKGIKGLRMGKFKGQTYLMANVDHCQPHIANAALLALLSLDNLALAPKALISDKSEYSPYPKLKRSSVSPAKISKPQHSVAADIEALRALHPDHILLPLKRLKSGSDAFSRMKAEDLKGKLSDEDLAQIEKRFTHDSLRLNAMRWAARGLPVSMAIKKVVLQQEDRDFFTSAHRAGQVLFEP